MKTVNIFNKVVSPQPMQPPSFGGLNNVFQEDDVRERIIQLCGEMTIIKRIPDHLLPLVNWLKSTNQTSGKQLLNDGSVLAWFHDLWGEKKFLYLIPEDSNERLSGSLKSIFKEAHISDGNLSRAAQKYRPSCRSNKRTFARRFCSSPGDPDGDSEPENHKSLLDRLFCKIEGGVL